MMEKFKQWVVDFLNSFIGIPGISEKQERIIIKGIVEFLFSFNPPDDAPSEVKKLGADFKNWTISFLNEKLDVPFLNEEQEAAVLNAIMTLLLNLHPPKEK